MSGHKRGIGGLFGKESSASMEVSLNLTPLMDVMSNILFFLMISFGATVVAIMPATTPVQSDGSDAGDAPEDTKVTMTIRADAKGLTLDCDNPTMTKDKLQMCKMQIPKKGTVYDLPTFTASLKKIKEKFPGSTSMVLVPEDNVRYEIVVQIMDAARDMKMPNNKKLVLFPDVVLSSIITHDAQIE